jgi:hypothetical protein
MSSIADLFELGNDDAPFDPTALNSALENIISGHRSRMGADENPIPPAPADLPGAPVVDDVLPVAPTADPAVAPEPEIPIPPPPAAAAPPADPFSSYDQLRRNELAIIARSLDDPERADAIRRAYTGVERAVAEPAPVAPAAPELPDYITPQSVEGQLWVQNQTLLRRVEAMESQSQQVQQSTVMDRARQAAQSATGRFVNRYGSHLSREEIEAVHKIAGQRRLPDAFIAARGGDQVAGAVEEGMYEALEFVLRSTDSLLARVLSPAASLPAPPVEPTPAFPAAPVPDGARERQRLLNALSTGASPVGAPPLRQPIEVDHAGGGRMTELSRRRLVEQAVSDLRGQELT